MRFTWPFIAIGAVAGALFGALFALGVIALADCAGPTCLRERVLGVAGHAVSGAAVGGLLGALIDAVVRHWGGRTGDEM